MKELKTMSYFVWKKALESDFRTVSCICLQIVKELSGRRKITIIEYNQKVRIETKELVKIETNVGKKFLPFSLSNVFSKYRCFRSTKTMEVDFYHFPAPVKSFLKVSVYAMCVYTLLLSMFNKYLSY